MAEEKQGGLAAMGERNRAKAQALYAAIDGSSLYRNRVAKDARSWMNVTFTLAKDSLDAEFPRAGRRRRAAQPQGAPRARRHAREPV